MITERTLRNWRRESLERKNHPILVADGKELNEAVLHETELHERILRLTMDLLDIHLVNKLGGHK